MSTDSFLSLAPPPKPVQWLSVRNFKSVAAEQKLCLGPLTVVAGANNSGKSTLLQPLLLIKQTIESPFDPGPLNLAGPNVNITSGADLVSKVPGTSSTEIGFRFGFAPGEDLDVVFSHSKADGVALVAMSLAARRSVLRLTPGEQFDLSSAVAQGLLSTALREALSITHKLATSQKVRGHVLRERCFLVARFYSVSDKGGRHLFIPRIADETYWYSESVAHLSRRLLHLPGWRGNPERTYNTSAVGKTFPGPFHRYLASLIKNWQDEKSDRIARLNEWLRLLGLTWKVEARSINETQIELRVGRLANPRRGGARDLVSIADVGFGVSQALPIIAGLLAAERGDVVYIEEPEIHLHPRAQEKLAEILVSAVKMGVRVVAETHSSIILRKLQTKVALGELDPQELKLHWCSRDASTGATRVSLAEVDKDGSFGDWPEDFADVEMEVERGYLDATFARNIPHGK